MATKSLGSLTLDLIARTGGFVKGMSKAERESKRWRRQVQRDLRKLGGQFGKFAKLAAGAGVAAAGAFTILAKEGLQYVDAQAKMARQIGASIDGLRALQIAGEDAGVSTETLNGAVDRMNSRLGEARRGSGQAYEALQRLGLSADALANMDADQRIAVIADRVRDLGLDSADTADLLRDLGIRNREMVNLLMQGGEAIREARIEVEEFGLSLNEIDSKAVEDANDEIGRIPRALEPIKNQIAINLAEPLQNVAELFNQAAKDSGNFSEAVINAMESAALGVAYLIDKLETVRKIYLTIREADLILQVGLEMSQNAVIPGDQPTPAADALAEVQESLDRIERGDTAMAGVEQFFAEMSQQFRENQARREALQAGVDAGLGDTITNEAIAAANAVADAMRNASSAANESADADEDSAEKTDSAAKAVEGLGEAADNSSKKMNDAANAMSGGSGGGSIGSNREPIGTNREPIGANRDAAVAGAGLMDRPGVINYGGAEGARPTWSTDFAPPGYLETAAQVGGSDPWSSVNAQKMASIQSTSESLSGHARNVKDRGMVTIKVAGDNGDVEGDVEGEDRFIQSLAAVLGGAAASTSPN